MKTVCRCRSTFRLSFESGNVKCLTYLGFTVYIHMLLLLVKTFVLHSGEFVIHIWSHHTLSCQYYLPQLETPRARQSQSSICPSASIFFPRRLLEVNPAKPLRGGWMLEWRNTSQAQLRVETRGDKKPHWDIWGLSENHNTGQNQAFGFCRMKSVPSWLRRLLSGSGTPEYSGHRCGATETSCVRWFPSWSFRDRWPNETHRYL